MSDKYTLYQGDCLEVMRTLEAQSVHCVVTSPPYYGLRSYNVDGQIGLEESPDEYVAKLVAVFREVWRVLRDDGTVWLNLGDSYAGNSSAGDKTFGNPEFNQNRPSRAETKTAKKAVPNGLKPKDLIGIPWRVAFALQADGWYLRQDIIWHKPNPMPESVTDRCTKAHEYIFLLSKSARYYYDNEAVKEKTERFGGAPRIFGANNQNGTLRNDIGRTFVDDGTRNRRSVWTVGTKPYAEAHFATYPPELITPCILAGCPVGGVVLDPFNGSGTTGEVTILNGRRYVGIELNPDYLELAKRRLESATIKHGNTTGESIKATAKERATGQISLFEVTP